MKTSVFDKKGKEIEKVDLPKEVFEVAWNADLVHQVMISMMSNERSNTAHAKDRSEVSGGGRKPWRQKGTGRARHGSIRSPLWRSGGVTFGPRNERNYDRKINKKMKAKAFAAVLSQKVKDNQIILVDSLSLSDAKTKEAAEIMAAIAKNKDCEDLVSKKNNSAIVALNERNEGTEKGFRNISNIRLDLLKNTNILDLLDYKYLVIENPKEAFKVLTDRVVSSESGEKREEKGESKASEKKVAKKSPVKTQDK